MTAYAHTATAEYAAPCLEAGPLAEAGRKLIAAGDGIGDGLRAADARARTVRRLFDGMEAAFAIAGDPLPPLLATLEAAAAELTRTDGAAPADGHDGGDTRDAGDIAEVTGEHYGQLFTAFSSPSYFAEPLNLLRIRLKRNGLSSSAWTGRCVLDAGCGGGRYTVAWRMLGARQTVGVDISDSGIADARRRVGAAPIHGVVFDQGDVLALPYQDDRFDVVFSNGVLHHTVNWRAGVNEVVRVLRPGGLGWLYLIENPGGYFWDVIEILRVLMRRDDRDAARRALAADGVPANRIFYMLDHVMVPINVRLAPAEVEAALAAAGATAIRRLTRGADFDRIEAIHRGDPFAREKYGVGENRFVFSK